MDTLETWQEVEAEEVTEGEGNIVLAMAVDIGLTSK
jgi:hypothetical protein